MSQAHHGAAGYREGRRNRWIVRGNQGCAGCSIDIGSEERVAAEKQPGKAFPFSNRGFAREVFRLRGSMNRARFVGYRATKIQKASSKNGFFGSTVQSAPQLCRAGILGTIGGNPETVQDDEQNSWDEHNLWKVAEPAFAAFRSHYSERPRLRTNHSWMRSISRTVS